MVPDVPLHLACVVMEGAETKGWTRVSGGSQEQLASLAEAVVAVGSTLDLRTVFRRVVLAACDLVDAEYGALGILTPDGEELAEFVTHGIDDVTRSKIGDPPRGHGVLGLLITDPHPVRLPDITRHPRSYGFPANHPPMHSFVGVPVRIRDQVFGNLYLSEKRGAAEFTPEDEALLIALASATSVAIDNARLYDEARRRRRWSEAAADMTQALLEGRDEKNALSIVAERVGDLVGADLVLVATYDPEKRLRVRAANAVGRDDWFDHGLDEDWWRTVIAGREPLLHRHPAVDDPTDPLAVEQATVIAALRRLGAVPPTGVTAVLPLGVGDADTGVVVVAWDDDGEQQAIYEMSMLAGFAQQVALALAAASAQRARARTAVLEDRDRIARDMHDVVIQRLFATGLSLQSATRMEDHDAVRQRLDSAVDEIDAGIKDIRHAIFALHRRSGPTDLRQELQDVVETASSGLGFPAELEIDGDLGTVPEHVAPDLLAVVREGLANVGRHSRAHSAEVHVEVGDQLRVQVRDDGEGVDPGSTRRSGLANLERRARVHGGRLELRPGVASGAVLVWTTPLGV